MNVARGVRDEDQAAEDGGVLEELVRCCVATGPCCSQKR
jgi:hypothetical protein